MRQCKCGSFAINKDPDRIICDVCYAYESGRITERERIIELIGIMPITDKMVVFIRNEIMKTNKPLK